MDPEQRKQTPHKTPFTQLEQVNSDFVLAITLQEQERAFSILSPIESESDEEEEIGSSNDNDDANFLESLEFEDELEFLEGEESNTDEDMEEDDIDLDELSYEELLALEEFVGEEKRGISVNEIPSCLHPYTFNSAERNTGIDLCVICQVEYEQGESLVALQCHHLYHSDCVSRWLQIKKACPICSSEISSPNITKNT
ncbi:E3 ubiquitin ligase big brother-like protein [Quillaja saponaria]|uniref:E3 ubiquitin ligase big brother-like protein n=1 Tax=Quillaja saponaria TaxID=32244 RepID=A0AAD7LYS0_QUISA|nr:E3 ubiquitin ligase big brother-like protein [Quillaja saponaria]